MQNVLSLGHVPYVKAEPLKETTSLQNFVFFILVFCDIVKMLVISTPTWFIAIYRCIISPPKKCVKGQTVLITGGGNGIGKALAFKFAEEGCNIAIADIDKTGAEQTVKELTAKNVIARAYHVDVADVDQIKKLKIGIERDVGPVDILCNNAAIIPVLSLREGSENEIERIVKVNITSQYFMTRAFLPGMIERRRGHIIGMSSMSSFHAMPFAIIYTSTKFAVFGFIRSLQQELRHEGNECIKVTSVHPYFVPTRKDLMNAINLRFPVITTEKTAEIAVDAILRNEQMVVIPKYDFWLTTIMNVLPFSIQNLIRDRVLKEKETKVTTYVEKNRGNEVHG